MVILSLISTVLRRSHSTAHGILALAAVLALLPFADANSGEMSLVINAPQHVSELEIRIESFRNNPITRNSDRSPLAPDSWNDKPPRLLETALWYPIMDVAPRRGMEAIAEFSAAPDDGVYVVNGMFDTTRKPLRNRISIPAADLLYWENLLWVTGGETDLTVFYLRENIAVRNGRAGYTITSISPEWRGRISWYDASRPDSAEIGHIDIDFPAPQLPEEPLLSLQSAPDQPPSRGQVLEAAIDWATFLLNARDQTPWSPTRDGFNLFYDMDASTYRTTHWMWAWGVDIRFLLEASRFPEIVDAFEEDLQEVAIKAGRRSLDFAWDKEGHPADGLVTVRWNPGHQWENGAKEFTATADALFLAGWAWIPLYEATGDSAFLNKTQRLADAVDKLSSEHPIMPQDWLPGENRWRITMLNEIAFGAEGFAELFRVRPTAANRDAGLRFMDKLISRFEREDGLWNRSSRFDADVAHAPGLTHTRGQAWVMEGLLAAHRIDPSGGYLKRAERLAAHLIENQHPSGAWSFEFDDDPKTGGISEKGTAVWSKLLYRLYSDNHDPVVLNAARKALWFCINNRYQGPDPHAIGGIFTSSPNSGIVYRHWFRMATTYGSAWAGMAAVEELKLQED